MLICTGAGEVQQLRWREGEEQPEVVHSIDVDMHEPNGLCYVHQMDAVVMTSQSPAHVRTVTLKNGFFLWKFTRKVQKLKLDCWGVTADNHGKKLLRIQPEMPSVSIHVQFSQKSSTTQSLLSGHLRWAPFLTSSVTTSTQISYIISYRPQCRLTDNYASQSSLNAYIFTWLR